MSRGKKSLDISGQIVLYCSSMPHNEVIVLSFFIKGAGATVGE